nr:MAG TPA: hypothetical protein [Caudoviricetes sp.]
MKVGDTVKLKPAMWQGLKPETYGLSFTGEYEVTEYFEGEYPSIKLQGFNGLFDSAHFQLVKEKEVNKFKVGDKVKILANLVGEEHGTVYTVAEDKEFQGVWIDNIKKIVHVEYVGREYRNSWADFELIEEKSIERPVLEERKKDKIRMELFDEGFPNAILEVAKVMTWASENKGYKDHDWVNLPDADSAFSAAASRHKLKGIIQKLNGVEALQRTDEESNILHKAHEAFNVLAELELMLRGVIK